ncbi:hypothetical protein [Leptothrix discophora]|uniref:Porin family protein n=1 Tax=Leptothrix discophora TaxID=89 RepID=A0ABT9G252_LEPDI|nr:hypothetical protein [Leptothrix discophora]MDP4300568.1 hypothetical protein [Leptothrix discophora]
MQARLKLLAGAALIACGAAHAADINAINQLNQTQFRQLSEDLGAAVSYKAMTPAEGLGLIGFDIGIGMTGTKLENVAALTAAAGGSDVPSTLPLVSVRAVKGLPFGVDVGVALGAVPGSNVRTTGGELRWAFVGGGMLTPAIAVRAAINNLSGVDNLKVDTTSLDVSISKGFVMFTPYAGVGTVKVKTSAPGTTLAGEKFNQKKIFGGVNINLGLVNLALETDKTGEATSYGAKVGLRF